LIIPLVAWLVRRSTLAIIFAIVLLSVVSLAAGTRALLVPQHLVDFFIGGAVVPLVAALDVRRPSRSFIAILALGAFLVAYFGRYLVGADFFTDYFSAPASLIEAVGSMFLIAAISAGRAHFTSLRHQALVLLGDVSYSLYLVHLTIMASTAYLLQEVIGFFPFGQNPILATLVLMLVTLVLAFFLSLLSYKYVELPGIKAGKALADQVRRITR
jgi:flagellin-like protein